MVKVHTLNGDHLTILDNDEVAATINGEFTENTAEDEKSGVENGSIESSVPKVNGA